MMALRKAKALPDMKLTILNMGVCMQEDQQQMPEAEEILIIVVEEVVVTEAIPYRGMGMAYLTILVLTGILLGNFNTQDFLLKLLQEEDKEGIHFQQAIKTQQL